MFAILDRVPLYAYYFPYASYQSKTEAVNNEFYNR